jgi:hypothetical protein
MSRLMALVKKHLGREYLDLTDWLRDENTISAIEERLIRGDYSRAVQSVDDAARRLAAEIQDSYVRSGRATTEWLDAKLPDKLVRFETASPEVVERARRNELELVSGFLDEKNQITRQIVQRAQFEGAKTGINPRRMARDFRDSIGLTATQEQWVANYRRSLESGDYTKALGYELSNGNADRLVSRAQAKGTQLAPEQIDKAVDQYRANAVTYRAETIARTESLRNTHEGAEEAMRQAVTRGDVDARDLVREWHAGPATIHARESHQEMDGVTVRFGEEFVLPDGTRMSTPGDPRGGAKHTASCRCTSSTSFAL